MTRALPSGPAIRRVGRRTDAGEQNNIGKHRFPSPRHRRRRVRFLRIPSCESFMRYKTHKHACVYIYTYNALLYRYNGATAVQESFDRKTEMETPTHIRATKTLFGVLLLLLLRQRAARIIAIITTR